MRVNFDRGSVLRREPVDDSVPDKLGAVDDRIGRRRARRADRSQVVADAKVIGDSFRAIAAIMGENKMVIGPPFPKF